MTLFMMGGTQPDDDKPLRVVVVVSVSKVRRPADFAGLFGQRSSAANGIFYRFVRKIFSAVFCLPFSVLGVAIPRFRLAKASQSDCCNGKERDQIECLA